MTLLFGRLTTAFVDFGTAAQGALGNGVTPEALQRLRDAADTFRNTAADDALYLVFIGKCYSRPLQSGICSRVRVQS